MNVGLVVLLVQKVHDVLVQANWIRTVAWSIFGLLDLGVLGEVIGSLP